MKKINKGIRIPLVCLSFLLILAILLLTVSYIFAPKGYWESFGQGRIFVDNAVLDEPENSLDVLFLGDSLVYSSVSPLEIWSNYGFTSFVCAAPAQQISYCEALLREVLEKQKPKAVVFEPNALYRKKKTISAIDARFEALFCVFNYHDDWKKVDKSYFSGYFNVDSANDFKGFLLSKKTKKGKTSKYMKETDRSKAFPDFNEEYFKSIVDICKEAGTELIVASVPSRKCWDYEKHNGVQALSEKYGVEYIDLNLLSGDIPIDWQTDTRDKGDHLNYSGALKISKFFGEYLKNNYSLSDRRGDDDYAPWNEALEKYLNYVKASNK